MPGGILESTVRNAFTLTTAGEAFAAKVAKSGSPAGTGTGELTPRRRWNVLAPKPYIAWVGRVRFPFDAEVYSHFNPGDTLLVEHLRWSRLPVAIYRGHPG